MIVSRNHDRWHSPCHSAVVLIIWPCLASERATMDHLVVAYPQHALHGKPALWTDSLFFGLLSRAVLKRVPQSETQSFAIQLPTARLNRLSVAFAFTLVCRGRPTRFAPVDSVTVD
ncbi:hypothetical protein B0H63DRAFT_458821 [Podospora didyma]|uniref:Uncharacterized protein n=1 Tax=Podospora didyma TaxID=330526 RepID=A0AAE0P5F2_9PEZI|nr:hypothetical protein B0H63DRAFT_458821 [Podospora didyma]